MSRIGIALLVSLAVLLIVSVAVVPALAWTCGDVVNGTFTSSQSPWVTDAAGLSWDGATGHTAPGCMIWDSGEGNYSSQLSQYDISLEGTTVYLTCWYRADTSGQLVTMSLTDGEEYLVEDAFPAPSDSSWHRYELTCSDFPGSGSYSVVVGAYREIDTDMGYLDDAALYCGELPPTPTATPTATTVPPTPTTVPPTATPAPTPDTCQCQAAMYLATIAAGTSQQRAGVITNTTSVGVVWGIDQSFTWGDVLQAMALAGASGIGLIMLLLRAVKVP